MKIWILYLCVGSALAAACQRRLKEPGWSERLVSALLCVAAWPLFAPIALWPGAPRDGNHESSASQRIKRALAEARAAVAGTELAELLPEAMLTKMFAYLSEIEQRRAELAELLARPDFQVGARTRDAALGGHEQSVERLRALHDRDSSALAEMVDLAEALRTHLLVARYSKAGRLGSAGSSGAKASSTQPGAQELALELAARVESLGAWFDLDSEPGTVDNSISA